jgi:hypothetical protein
MRTKVEFRQIFSPKQNPVPDLPWLAPVYDRLRTIVVNVNWKAKVSASAEFTEESVDTIDFPTESFRSPITEDYIQLRHPRYAQPDTPKDS